MHGKDLMEVTAQTVQQLTLVELADMNTWNLIPGWAPCHRGYHTAWQRTCQTADVRKGLVKGAILFSLLQKFQEVRDDDNDFALVALPW